MQCLVCDTTIPIDIERCGVWQALLSLPYQFAVPDLVYKRELEGAPGDFLRAQGLRVERLMPEETAIAVSEHRAGGISTCDAFALALASHRGWTLLTSCSSLGNLARRKGLVTKGILWLLDECEVHAVLGTTDLSRALHAVAGHPRCRLPKGEVAVRLARWSK